MTVPLAIPSRDRPGGRRAALAVLCVVLTFVSLAPAAAAPLAGGLAPTGNEGQGPATFGVAPADGHKVDGRPAFFYSATPGADLTDHVAFVNSGLTPISLSVYATDAVPSSTGEFALTAVNARGKDVGTWISLVQAGPVTIPARTSRGPSVAIVAVRMHIPAHASPGDHAGGIVASLGSSAVAKSGQRFKLLQRVGARVFVRVSGPLHPLITVERLQASPHVPLSPLESGQTVLRFAVHNAGNVKLGGLVTVTVRGLLGTSERVRLHQLPLLLPGSVVPERVVVPHVYPEGLMTAQVRVDAVAVPGDVDPPTPPTVASVHFLAVPWAILAFLLLLGLLALGAWWRRRSGRRSPTPAQPAGAFAPGELPGQPAGRFRSHARSRRRLAS